MRNSNRSRRAQRPEHERQVAGVGEFRAVAERLLETGAQYLEQGREWLHAATRGQSQDTQGEHRGHDDVDASFDGPRGRRHRDNGPYAPDEYSFSETGGVSNARGERESGSGGPHPRGFEPGMDGRHSGRGGPRSRHAGWRSGPHRHGDDGFLPGSYGFGGEGRRQPGGFPEDGHGHGDAGDFEASAGRWERAYDAQGQGSHRGRGPRGYVRSDERILDDVNQRLCDDAIVDATDIEVHCDQGRVILEGRVPMRWMKHRAEDIADSVQGAKDIDNRIRVIAEEPAPKGDFDTSQTTGATNATPRSSQGAAAATSSARGARNAERNKEDAGAKAKARPPH